MNAYTRWARLVVHGVSSPTDLRTLALWSAHAAVSESTLRARCAAARVSVAAARDFSRLLRVIVRSQHTHEGWDPARDLDARDARTIRRLLLAGGLADWPHGRPPPPIERFLAQQHLIPEHALTAVRQVLSSTQPLPTHHNSPPLTAR